MLSSGWKASGITDAFKAGKRGLESLDPFNDIDPMMEQPQNPDTLRSICDLTESQLAIAYSLIEENESDCESEWGRDDDIDRNAFDDLLDE